jgi:hypothetical protein
VGEQVPAARPVPRVVEPRAEDEVGCDSEEDPALPSADCRSQKKRGVRLTG